MVSHRNLYPEDLVRLDVYGPQDRKLILEALDFARERHAGQRRIAGPAFITHPIAATQILIDEFHPEPEVVIATLLHDTVEDTATTLEEIEERFGAEIRFLVDGATNVGCGDGAEIIPDKAERARATHEKIRRYAEKDGRVYLIKIADRWHNLLTCGAMRAKSREANAREAVEFHVPACRTLGFSRQADELSRIAHDVLSNV